jgi:hypothetical protein
MFDDPAPTGLYLSWPPRLLLGVSTALTLRREERVNLDGI